MEWLLGKRVGSARVRKEKMRTEGMQQLVTTLAVFDAIEGRKATSAAAALVDLSSALRGCCQIYGDQDAFVSYLSFLAKAIDEIENV